jgi:hypothetical protein
VDRAFLAEIEAWREALAKDIARNNADLSIHDLNEAVQATIDRILFLRIAEDRGVERYGRLRGLVDEGGIYGGLLSLFGEAEEKYNSGLFDFGRQGDGLSRGLTVSDKVLKGIVGGLYYPDCPYEFSVLGADILGAVYEQFLGKTIRLTAGHHAKVEEKPEVRKAGGVYYTPTYIVDYIVKHTVGELLEEAGTPERAAELRILDPACGSGSFLLGAYQYLLDWHLRYYVAHDPEKRARERNPKLAPSPTGDWRLSLAARKGILTRCIYGVDLDRQAVEVAKLNLLLKCMEGETEQTVGAQMRLFHDRVLPNIDANIKCGNSLIGPDYWEGRQESMFDGDEARRVNPFDWDAGFPEVMKRGGFDAVIGNPPYGMIEDAACLAYLRARLASVEGRCDAFELFTERGLALAKVGGLFSYIMPTPFLTNVYTRKLREMVVDSHRVESIASFGMEVFEDPTVHSCIIVVRAKCAPNAAVGVRSQVLSAVELAEPWDYHVDQRELTTGPTRSIDVFMTPLLRRLLGRLDGLCVSLASVCYLRQCIKTGNDGEYVRSASEPPGEPWKPTLRGRGITRYSVAERQLYVKYGPWLARNWANTTFYETPKIVVRETGRRIVAALDTEDRYVLSSLYAVYPRTSSDGWNLKYILGLLNSRFVTFLLHGFALGATAGAFTKVRINQLGRVPVRVIDNPDDVAKHDRMVSLVDTMLELHRRLPDAKTAHDRELIQRQIDATDRQIDRLVYDLYGLSDEEIAIVEEAT